MQKETFAVQLWGAVILTIVLARGLSLIDPGSGPRMDVELCLNSARAVKRPFYAASSETRTGQLRLRVWFGIPTATCMARPWAAVTSTFVTTIALAAEQCLR